MKRRSRPPSVSEKRKRSGVRTRHNSTILAVLPTNAERLAAMDSRRGASLPARKAPIRKVNPARRQKLDRAYQQKLALYRKSATYRLVEQRCDGRCEFAVLDVIPRGDDDRYLVLDVRIDRALPEDYVRCGKPRRSHHHRVYHHARFGGDELSEDMLAGCTRCHEYVEATKLVHRHRNAQ